MIDSSLTIKKPNQTKNKKLMKTTFYIIVTVFGLQSNLLFANGGKAQSLFTDRLFTISREVRMESAVDPPANLFNMKDLAPSVPAVATFDDEEMTADLKSLLPNNPKEADFSDNDLIPKSSPALNPLMPITPREANFNDSDAVNPDLMLMNLAPLTPKEADFIDTDINGNAEAGCLAPVIPDEAEFEDHV
jgi:hypothetical protein